MNTNIILTVLENLDYGYIKKLQKIVKEKGEMGAVETMRIPNTKYDIIRDDDKYYLFKGTEELLSVPDDRSGKFIAKLFLTAMNF